jgi:hypothetical protein
MCKEVLFIFIFICGEILFNYTWYSYLKRIFKPQKKNSNNPDKILFMYFSTFKGVMERFILTIGLIFGFLPILIVFGTIKLGTRFSDKQEIENDYFLIGNFSSILISIFYFYVLNHMDI